MSDSYVLRKANSSFPSQGSPLPRPQILGRYNRSSRNATKPGVLSNLCVREEEPIDVFNRLQASYLQRFSPLDVVETGMIHEMLATYWRMPRAWDMGNRLFDKAIAAQDRPSPIDRLTDAFTVLPTPAITASVSSTVTRTGSR